MFELVKDKKAATFFVDEKNDDYNGLVHTAKKICEDIFAVTDVKPEINNELDDAYQIVAATVGKSQFLDELVKNNTLSIDTLKDRNESYMIKNVGKKLYVIGTQTVATVHGLYHISRELGVSPWIYWADVLPKKQEEIVFQDFDFTSKEPSVKYRGFFMNDEWPSLGNFVMNTFGDFNARFYDRVYELLLRLRGNYFWPAMWSASLSLDGEKDDPLKNVRLATELGITIGNSHHEPLMRSSEEWDKVKSDTNNEGYGKDWNYYTNEKGLYRYWEDGVERNKSFNHMITIGMRGERDTTMLPPDSSVQENVELLRKIITDQKRIIKEKGCDDMPKMLALYKEVEGYYYGGNGVKGLKEWDGLDDTILLLSDDNFANVRTLPTKENKDRKAGWGLYYHFDYHGAPVSYEWVNSTPLPKVWEQLTMAYEYGIKDLWIVNVGDIRPDELPLSYYMDLAYDYEGMGIDHPNETDKYLKQWVETQFGAYLEDEDVKEDIVAALKAYTRIHGNKRPETVKPDTYHVTNFDESYKMIVLCNKLISLCDSIEEKMPKECKDAFYGLVYYPAVAGANVQLMNLYAGQNWFLAKNGIFAANNYKKLVEKCVVLDKKMQDFYNEKMADGKWKGMMLSAHVCFENWNDENWHYPETVDCKEGNNRLNVYVEGAQAFVSEGKISLPEFTSEGKEKYRLVVANSKDEAILPKLTCNTDLIEIAKCENEFESLETFFISVNDKALPNVCDITDIPFEITVEANSCVVIVKGNIVNSNGVSFDELTFVERDGYVSLEAERFSKENEYEGYAYKKLTEYGKTLSTMKIFPVDRNFDELKKSPSLTYYIYIREGGEYTLRGITAPTNNLMDGRNMRYAISFDDKEAVECKTILDEGYNIGGGNAYAKDWGEGVLNNCHYGECKISLTPGVHSFTLYGMEAGVALQKFVLYKGDYKPSFFGPSECGYIKAR